MINYLLLLAYELLAALLPFLLVFAVSAARGRKAGRPLSLPRFLPLAVFAVYISASFFFTSAGTLADLLRLGFAADAARVNFVPFSNAIDTVAYLQNILLFIPLGFLLPLLWPRTDKFRYAPLCGLAFSLLIEASQLLNHRATDVDDLIMNTLGACLGYLGCKLFARLAKRRGGSPAYPRAEPLIYVAAMFMGRFLLFNEMGFARILYGF